MAPKFFPPDRVENSILYLFKSFSNESNTIVRCHFFLQDINLYNELYTWFLLAILVLFLRLICTSVLEFGSYALYR